MYATKTAAKPLLLWRGSTLDNFTLQLTQSGLSKVMAHLTKQPYLKDFVAGNYTGNLPAAVASSLARLTQDALYVGTISDPNSNQKIRVFESTTESGSDYQILALAVSKTESTIISVRLVPQSEETEHFIGAALKGLVKVATKVAPKVLPKIGKAAPRLARKAKPAARRALQKARPLGRRTLQKARPLGRRTLQKARPLGRRTLQKARPLGRRTLQKARPLGRRTLQKARPLGRRTLQKARPLGRRTLQKARPLGRRTLQKARPLGRRTLQKVRPFGRPHSVASSMRNSHLRSRSDDSTLSPRSRSIGLPALFGLDRWQAGGQTNPTSNQFERLRNAQGRISTKKLLNLIPAGTPNTFDIEPRTQRGFKFEWRDPDGTRWHVHGHEPDPGAHAGHVGRNNWVVRIRKNDDWLLSQPLISNFPSGHANYRDPIDWSRARGNQVARLSHIPLLFDY